ncbi:MAG TPA: NAD(P)/FAD-dependent oxidoreductase [Pyrinomonadaceae bacterium]|nr:NAD(P)/FAD-dependent oxidoreductase [Pyrinomonadaceae bacterium]
MAYEVVVVGGGIGGLTTAALLSARGVNVCLLERQSQPGGCVSPFEAFGYNFESGMGLYALWNKGEIHDRVFAELPVNPPKIQLLDPAYIVRLPDHSDVVVSSESERFLDSLRMNFPECAEAAIAFYRDAELVGAALLRAVSRVPDLLTASRFRQLGALWPNVGTAARLRDLLKDTTDHHLEGTSRRFRCFVDAQLQLFGQCSAAECAYPYACVALTLRQQGFFAIEGGAGELAQLLAQSIAQTGGAVRLNTPALRLAYDSSGRPIGVTLLSGETVTAARAIVSNLTVWDTYGKLVGLDHTPLEIRKRLKTLSGWGAYLIYTGVEERVASTLPADHLVAVTAFPESAKYDPTIAQINFAMAPQWNPRAPAGHRAATVQVSTHADQWFAFHEDESEQEMKDQSELETVWQRLHSVLPELGDAIEVIDTATPQSYYASTRRKLGMVGSVGQSPDVFGPNSLSHRTNFRNLFMVGDTIFPGAGLAAVSQGAVVVADEICSSRS